MHKALITDAFWCYRDGATGEHEGAQIEDITQIMMLDA